MSKLAKTMLLGVAAVAVGLTGQKAVGGEVFPNVDDLCSFAQFGPEKYQVGNDGNSRLIWDYINPSPTKYLGSALWILNPQGQVVATGDTQIPASVGTGIDTFGNSNIAIHIQPSGNTTLAFAGVLPRLLPSPPPLLHTSPPWLLTVQRSAMASGGYLGGLGTQSGVADVGLKV